MFVYYYEKDTIYEGMPDGFSFKKGTVSMFSESNSVDESLSVVEMEIPEEFLNDMSCLMYNEKTQELYYDEELRELQRLQLLRVKRQPLLSAFDRYNIAVTRGIIEETNKEKTDILTWYRLILDLNEDALNNPPECIKYFIN